MGIYNIIDRVLNKKFPQISKKSKLFASDAIFLAKSEKKITPVEAGISSEPSTHHDDFCLKKVNFPGGVPGSSPQPYLRQLNSRYPFRFQKFLPKSYKWPQKNWVTGVVSPYLYGSKPC